MSKCGYGSSSGKSASAGGKSGNSPFSRYPGGGNSQGYSKGMQLSYGFGNASQRNSYAVLFGNADYAVPKIAERQATYKSRRISDLYPKPKKLDAIHKSPMSVLYDSDFSRPTPDRVEPFKAKVYDSDYSDTPFQPARSLRTELEEIEDKKRKGLLN